MSCPLNGKKCVKGKRSDFEVDDVGEKVQCRMWTHVVGMDPQTGGHIDLWDCSLAWSPVLMVEQSNQIRQATASVDKTANIIYGSLPIPAREQLHRMMPSLGPGPEAPKQLTNGDAQ